MTTVQSLLAFVAAASVLTVTPGLDTAFVLRSVTAGGSRPAAFAAAGIGLGCLVWGIAASIGLEALLAASTIAYTALRWAGAAYLIWLGMSLLRRPRQQFDVSIARPGCGSDGQFLRQGLLTNLLNPKVGLFYISFLPQFIPAGVNVALFSILLAAIHVLLGMIWFALLIVATVPIGRFLKRPSVVKIMDRVTGAVLLTFGARLALWK